MIQDDKRVWGRSGHSAERYDNSVGMVMLEPDEALIGIRPYADQLRNYAIYQPSTPVLRGILSDNIQLSPLGLNGGRLAEAIEEILTIQEMEKDGKFFSLAEDIQELKIWHGQRRNKDGEQQIIGYLERFGLTIGYMLSFNFNKDKEPGVKEVHIGDKILYEGTV